MSPAELLQQIVRWASPSWTPSGSLSSTG